MLICACQGTDIGMQKRLSSTLPDATLGVSVTTTVMSDSTMLVPRLKCARVNCACASAAAGPVLIG